MRIQYLVPLFLPLFLTESYQSNLLKFSTILDHHSKSQIHKRKYVRVRGKGKQPMEVLILKFGPFGFRKQQIPLDVRYSMHTPLTPLLCSLLFFLRPLWLWTPSRFTKLPLLFVLFKVVMVSSLDKINTRGKIFSLSYIQFSSCRVSISTK